MKSTIYQHHLRASASFSYRHLLHLKRGDPQSTADRAAVRAQSAEAVRTGQISHGEIGNAM